MRLRSIRIYAVIAVAVCCLLAGFVSTAAFAQSSDSSSNPGQGSSSQGYKQERSPTLIDPAGPTISLIPSEQLFVMAAALNACGYNEGLEESSPVRNRIREEMSQALTKSEDARAKRDKLCLFIAQHRMTGTEKDIAQYISLALYLTPPPELEISTDLEEMPPDATQVAEIVPLLKDFAEAVDLHGTWLAVHRTYDEQADQLHDALSAMIVATNLYLKIPASTYDGRRFIVVFEPQFSPSMVNARIYGTDYVVVVSPVNGKIRISDVRHTYLHYVIEPLLFQRSNAVDRMQPILKEVRDAPLPFQLRNETVPLAIECLIKAIEARTMDTGIPVFKIPQGTDRGDMPRLEHERQIYQQKVDAARLAAMRHDVNQGYVLTRYFYEQLIGFEKDPSGLKDTIGEMVYSMDMDHEVRLARNVEFDQEADEEVLERSQPRKLTGLDLAESKLAAGDVEAASAIARQVLSKPDDSLQGMADNARANFILARAAILTAHPEQAIDDFQKTLGSSKDARLLSWSHIYLGRMLDLDCKRDEAVAEYKEALATRDGQQDTRLAAERGVKTAYAVKGHSCEDTDDETPPEKPDGAAGGQNGAEKPQ